MAERGERRRFGPARAWSSRWLAELAAVSGLAVAQPLLDLLGRNARLLIAWRTTTATALLMVLTVIVGPVLATWLLEVVVGLVLPRPWVHDAALGVWTGVLAVIVAHRVADVGPVVAVVVGVLATVGACIVLARVVLVRTWLRFLAVAPVLFAFLFVSASPATGIVFASEPGFASVTPAHPHRLVMIVMDEFPLDIHPRRARRDRRRHVPEPRRAGRDRHVVPERRRRSRRTRRPRCRRCSPAGCRRTRTRCRPCPTIPRTSSRCSVATTGSTCTSR